MTEILQQADCCLNGRTVRIRPLRFGDLPELAAWEPHRNPLLASYNLHFDSMAGWRRWLQARLQTRWPYAIRNSDQELVGHLSLRQIDHPRSARLGITIGAAFTGRGYGQDSMYTFLDHYFGDLGFNEMRLDVSGANMRARRLYRKLGFRQLHSFWLSATYHDLGAQGAWVRNHLRNGKEQYYEMSLTVNQWWDVRASLG
jgi:RimJ/RimL family protein N-acetyltransferase